MFQADQHDARPRVSARVMTIGHMVSWALAAGAMLAACGQRSHRDLPGGGGGAGSDGGLGETSTGGRNAGSGGEAPSDGAVGIGHSGGAVASGGALGSGGGAAAGSSGAGGHDGVGGAGGAVKVMEPYFRAGTRLKPHVYELGGLAVLDETGERGWVDKQTGVACVFRMTADGVERCLPGTGTANYSDRKCTQPVVRGPKPGSAQTPVPFVAYPGASACGDRVYRVDTSRTGTGPVYYVADDGSCTKLVDRVPSGEAVYGLVEEPLSTFVAVKRVSRPRAPHMDALVREGEDGSSEVVGFIDPVRKQPCFGLGMNVSSPRCVPGWQRMDDTFTDSDCTKAAGFDESISPCPTRPNAALLKFVRNDVTCRDQSLADAREIAGTVRTPLFVRENGTCALNGGSAEPVELLLAGAPIDLASLPKLELIDVGGGPLRVRFYGFEGVPFLPVPVRVEYLDKTGPLIDAATGEWCDPYPFADGQWRCVPLSFERVLEPLVQFASPDCTGVRLFTSVSLPFCSDKGREPRGVVVTSVMPTVSGYDQVVGTFAVTGKVTPSIVSSGASPSCRSTIPAGGVFYEANKVLNPADVFAPLERTVSD